MKTDENLKSSFDDIKKNWVLKPRVYVLKSGSTPPWYQINSKHLHKAPLLYFDEERSEQRELRFASNQPTPFVDEQKGVVRPEQIGFVDGFINTSRNDVSLQQFLTIHPGNVDNGGNSFREVRPEEKVETDVATFEDKASAYSKIKDIDSDELEAVMFEQEGSRVFSTSTKELKRDLYILAERDPALVIELMESDMLKLKTIGAKAAHYDILTIADGGTSIRFKKNNKKICAVSMDTTPWQAFADFCLTDEGTQAVKVIQKLINDYTK